MPDVAAHDARPPREPLVSPGGMDLHASDMTATFAADVTLRAAQDRLAEIGQWLPIDGDPDTALGTLVETDSTGPLRLGYGAWRDLLLGVQFRNGLEELISAGGRTMKNVAGYDLTKLMVGQRGAFGRIMSITVRTYRRPAGAVIARFAPDASLLGRLLPTPLRPQWAVLGAAALWCGYLGDEHAGSYYTSRLPDSGPVELMQRSLDAEIAFRGTLWQAEGDRTFRASVPPARIAAFVDASRVEAWSADAAFGIVIGAVASDAASGVLTDAARSVDGTVSLRSRRPEGPLPSASGADAFTFSTTPPERQIIERLKRAFDPDNRLTPLPWQTR